jgi:hypothetical protein
MRVGPWRRGLDRGREGGISNVRFVCDAIEQKVEIGAAQSLEIQPAKRLQLRSV